jgi:DNA ligase-1
MHLSIFAFLFNVIGLFNTVGRYVDTLGLLARCKAGLLVISASCLVLSKPRFYLLSLLAVLLAPGLAAQPPDLLLANVYRDQSQLDDYWVSEKLDGVRAYWDGQHLISRQGNTFNAPDWFTVRFPAVPLDGELWMGRETFERLSGTVRQLAPDDSQWRKVRYMVFDLPQPERNFDERLQQLEALIDDLAVPHLQLVKQFKVADRDVLMLELDRVVKQGGEGLILHRGASLYHSARSDDLLKVKTHDDAEATVIAQLPGKGKYQGMMGALLVETPDGRRFKIGTGFSDAERTNPPPIGALISYKYFGTTNNNIPRFASFLRIRYDLTPVSVEQL